MGQVFVERRKVGHAVFVTGGVRVGHVFDERVRVGHACVAIGK